MKKRRFQPMKTAPHLWSISLVPLLLMGCASHVGKAPDSTGKLDIHGSWLLKTVGGRSPDVVAIKTWRISFSGDQQWTYSGEMTGRFAGMQVSGSGRWTLQSDVLNYAAENNKGESKITVKDGVLTLSPDPVIAPGGKTRVVTTYVPVSSP
jgi:hypothetical protein